MGQKDMVSKITINIDIDKLDEIQILVIICYGNP